MRALILPFAVLFLCGSGCETARCSATTCSGCCDTNDQCLAGNGSGACGAQGTTCGMCSFQQVCQLGICTNGAAGGGTAGGGGFGGGSQGGGSAGGGGVIPVDPQLLVDRHTLGFGQEFQSGTWVNTAPQQSLLLRNGGQGNLVISSVALSGADAAAFSISPLNAGTTLTTGDQRFVRVIFTPTQARTYSATLTVSSNAGGPAVITLSGQGLASTPGPGLNPECRADACLSPPERNGGALMNADWLTYTEDGPQFSYVNDADGDARADDLDNCPFSSNRDQLDVDGDGVGNACDNCVSASNFNQLDQDADGLGDGCDSDLDGDGVPNETDTCANLPNPTQLDTNSNALGNACDSDDDGDGILDTLDVCPLLSNPGNVLVNDPRCNADADGDNVSDAYDNCPGLANPAQADTDLDGLGDACDLDADNDGLLDVVDNCTFVANRDQADGDLDGKGDRCDVTYCVVVDPSNKLDCLDPTLPFRVHAGGALSLRVGGNFRLPLFANRNGAAFRYTWSVASAPTGSFASVVNPTGLVGMSRQWEYAYVDGLVPGFRPDVAGDYTLQLQATLGVADRAYPSNLASTSTLRLTVSQ